MGTYLALLRRPGAVWFSAAGFIGRLPMAMLSLGVVLLVTAQGGSYARAGVLSAAVALAAAFISPLGLRWADRAGQAATIGLLATAEALALVMLTVAVERGWAFGWQFLCSFAAGATSPHVGSLVRARWAAQLSGTPQLRSAFAWEAVIDEVVFIVGPPLMTLLAVGVGESAAIYTAAGLLLAGVWWLASQRATQPRLHPRTAEHPHSGLWSGTLVVVLAVLLLLGGVFGSFEVATVAFSRSADAAGLTGVVLALYAAGSLVAGLALGARSPKVGPGTQVLLYSAALALVGAPLPWVGSMSALLVLAFLAGLSVAPLLIVTTAIIETLVPAARLTEALGISISALAVGVAVGSSVSGAVVDTVSPNAGYAVMACCGVGALAVATAGRPVLGRRPRARS